MNERTTEFDTFWRTYPRRTGRFAAQKAYAKARTQASAAEILAGVENYKRNKPAYADWCHPTTFLNQGRWMDEPDAPPSVAPQIDWYDECQRLHSGTCGGRLRHHNQKAIDEMKAREAS